MSGENGVTSELSTTPYRGGDRRSAATAPPSPFGVAYAVAVVLLTVATLVVLVPGLLGTPWPGAGLPALSGILVAGGTVLAVLVGVLCIMRWRILGLAPALWVGAALVVYGILVEAVAGLGPHLGADWSESPFVSIRLGSGMIVAGCLLYAVATPAVNTRLGPWRLVPAALVGSLLVALPLTAVPAPAIAAVKPVMLSVVWLGLAVVYVFTGIDRDRWLFAWFGLMLLALALAETPFAGTEMIAFLGLCFGLVGASRELQHAFVEQNRRLLDSRVAAEASAARMGAAEARQRRLAHDAASALAAIGGAAQAIERYHDRLSPEDRASLATGIGEEIVRLQRLVTRGDQAGGTFEVPAALEPVVAEARLGGDEIAVDLPPDLTALGSEVDTVGVVQRLLVIVQRRTADGAVAVTGWRVGDEVRIAIAGAAPAAERAGTDDFTLSVCERLLLAHGGRLHVEETAGGITYTIILPAASDDGARGQAADERGQGGEVVDHHRLLAVRRDD